MESSAVANNQLFVGGLGLYGVAIGAFAVRHLGRYVKSYIERSLFVSLEISSKDISFQWIMRWIAAESLIKCQQLSIMSTSTEILANDAVRSDTFFVPAPNVSHTFIFKNKYFFLKRTRPTDRLASAENLAASPETLTLSTLGCHTRELLDLFNTARSFVAQEERHKTVLYNCAGTRWVRYAEPRRSRKTDSVILREGLLARTMTDMDRFLECADWYHKMGIPYRRGYLLYGPPGCGKSSLVMALAGKFSLAICMVNLSNRSLDDDMLNQLFNAAPKKCAILIEDIDLAFHADSRITISGLLNALDGVTAQEGRVVFMTTNHIERLSAALVRPGRVDVRMYIGFADDVQVRQMFLRFFPQAIEQAEKFTAALRARALESKLSGFSTAEIQGFLFYYREDVNGALTAVETYFAPKEQKNVA